MTVHAFTIYDSATGMIVRRRSLADPQDIVYALEEGQSVVEGRYDPETVCFVGGLLQERPIAFAFPETGAAPLEIDCSVVGGEVLFRNEAGDEATETSTMTLTDPGRYEVVPPFPYQRQTVVLD